MSPDYISRAEYREDCDKVNRKLDAISDQITSLTISVARLQEQVSAKSTIWGHIITGVSSVSVALIGFFAGRAAFGK
jgi:hypothetical protein